MSRLEAAGVGSLAALMGELSDGDKISSIGLDDADIHELNEIFKRNDIRLVLVPVFRESVPSAPVPIETIQAEMFEVFRALSSAAARLAMVLESAAVAPANKPEGGE
jgi:hypothetical protein